MKIIRRLGLISLGVGLGMLASAVTGLESTSDSINSNVCPVVEQIQRLSSLATLKIDVADALVTQLQGYTGSTQAVLVVHGSVTLGVDLSVARFESVNARYHRAILCLPEPRIQVISLDQQRTRLVGFWSNGLWRIVPGDEEADTAAINAAYRQAQQIVAQAAANPEIIERSRGQAEQVLQAFFTAMGWRVRIYWPVVRSGSG
jgi:hypothetical protein